MPPIEPTHGDILVQIGELKGQVSTLITLVGQKREDLNAAFARLGALEKDSASHLEVAQVSGRVGMLEKEQAKWAGICLVVALLMPALGWGLQKMISAVEDYPTQQPHHLQQPSSQRPRP